MALRRPSGKSVGLISKYQSVGSLIRHYLTCEAEMNVIWEAHTGATGMEHCTRKPPTIVIVSPMLVDMGGLEVVETIRKQNSDTRILLFAGVIYRALVQEMMAAGVHGIVAAQSPLECLRTAVDVLMAGGCYFDPTTEALIHAPAESSSHLSGRERLVLRLVAEGFSTKEIARELSIGVKTADKFRERIMTKLGLHDAVKLTRYAIRHGISRLA